MRDLGEKVKLGRIAHQEYYIIINSLSQAELAKSVSHNDFARIEEASDRTKDVAASVGGRPGDIENEGGRVANGASNKIFTRKPDKGGCEAVNGLVGDGCSCVVIHGGINKYGVERTAKLSTFHTAVHCRSHEAGRYAASFISRRK